MNEDIFYMCKNYAIQFLTREITLLKKALASEETVGSHKPILEDKLKKYENDLKKISNYREYM